MKAITEFDGERARLYEQALTMFPTARDMDLEAMHRILAPRAGEKILGLGEGNGFFCKAIIDAIGHTGYYLVTDPSQDQLNNLERRVRASQLEVRTTSAERLDMPVNYFDKVWSFGAFHHFSNQTEAMRRIYDSLKKGGTMVICDVFQGSTLAKHFDAQVARYCINGHEVKFLSDEFAKTLCFLVGFEDSKIQLIDLPQQWKFDSEKDIGHFIHDLHALTLIEGEEHEKIAKILKDCRNMLGIEIKNGKYCLQWPMKALKAIK